MENIQIFEPEITSFSVTVKFICEAASQSGYKMITDWISHFISSRSVNPSGKEDYSNCIAILKHASFCEGTFAEVLHKADKNNKYVQLTIHFNSLANLTKFVETLKESVRFT